jgi:hypothetical protein
MPARGQKQPTANATHAVQIDLISLISLKGEPIEKETQCVGARIVIGASSSFKGRRRSEVRTIDFTRSGPVVWKVAPPRPFQAVLNHQDLR